jgi:ferredoxin-NADP reductase
MSHYRTRLKSSEEIAEGTMAFYFERPAGFTFKAGQYVDLKLLDSPANDPAGIVRSFTIASAPFEDQIEIATRIRTSGFKRMLNHLVAGSEVEIDGPMGSFTLHKNASRPAVFLAGGIGISPFLSIAQQATHDRLPHRIYLFYSDLRPETTAYLDRLAALEKLNPNLRLIVTMTEMAHSRRPWAGESGFIDAGMLQRYLSELRGPLYYVAGPPVVVGAMRQMLAAAGVDEDDIRSEEFSGY